MLPLLLLACTSVAPTTGPLPQDTSDSASSAHQDTATVEQLPGVAEEPGLCHLTLTCSSPIRDEPKTLCQLLVADEFGRIDFSGPAGLDTRGRSSSDFPKKQYAAELWDESGESVEHDLLGMGSESDWILNGAYVDRALFRSSLIYDSFQAFSEDGYAPETRFCELSLNDTWLGIYVLTERVKRDGSRLAIAPDESGDASTFVVKLDDEDGVIANTGGTGTWQLVYPRDDDATAGQVAGVYSTLNSWITAYTGTDPSLIFEHIDLASAVDLVIAEELAKNVDGYYLSLYLYREAHEPLRWVPWDLDLTFGQPSYNDNESPQGWILSRPSFIGRMGDDPTFKAALTARWTELRAGPLAQEVLLERIDTYVAIMGDTVYENFQVWPIEDIEFGWSGENYLYAVSSYDEELARVRDWLPRRLAWMDDNIQDW